MRCRPFAQNAMAFNPLDSNRPPQRCSNHVQSSCHEVQNARIVKDTISMISTWNLNYCTLASSEHLHFAWSYDHLWNGKVAKIKPEEIIPCCEFTCSQRLQQFCLEGEAISQTHHIKSLSLSRFLGLCSLPSHRDALNTWLYSSKEPLEHAKAWMIENVCKSSSRAQKRDDKQIIY